MEQKEVSLRLHTATASSLGTPKCLEKLFSTSHASRCDSAKLCQPSPDQVCHDCCGYYFRFLLKFRACSPEHLFIQIMSEEVCEFIPGDEVLGLALAYQLSIAAIVEVAMAGTGDDEQLFVLWIGIGLAHDIISLGLAFHHILIGSLSEVA